METLAAGAAPFVLPPAYLDFLRRSNGAEGDVGHSEFGWCQLWPAQEVLQLNDGYEVQEAAPSFFAIGSDGGGEILAFDFSAGPASSPRMFMLPIVPLDPSKGIELTSDFSGLAALFGRRVD